MTRNCLCLVLSLPACFDPSGVTGPALPAAETGVVPDPGETDTPPDETPDGVGETADDPGAEETGEYETGEYETGEYETGEYETGEYETGEYETGGTATGEPVEPLRVFVTSRTFRGDEVALADQHCAVAATDAELGGQWFAWIGNSFMDAVDKLDPEGGPYARLDGTWIASDTADLLDGTLDAPINLDETGTAVAVTLAVWTGSNAAGNTFGNACLDWTVGTNAQDGRQGYVDRTDNNWTSFFHAGCNVVGRLYCFER